MNIKKMLMGFSAGALMLGSVPATALAAQPWNVTGDYEVTFLLMGDETPYIHHMTLNQTDSTITGNGGYPVDGSDSYHWNITVGSQIGDSLNLTSEYDLGAVGTTMNMVGTIASDGTVTDGTWDDNFGGSRTGTWSITKGVSVPAITTPTNNAAVTTSALVKIDWTDSVGSSPAFMYQYQAYSDSAYSVRVYDSGMALTSSEIPTPSTPPGVYYIRVMAADVVGTLSSWSNGPTNPFQITVTTDSLLVDTPTNMDQCKKDGWLTFNNPSFKNQGQCVSFVQSNDSAGKRN